MEQNTGHIPGLLVFEPGALEREIVIRGLSLEAFAKKAKVDPSTITRASKGLRLKPKSFGKILIALGRIPPIDGPTDLVKAS